MKVGFIGLGTMGSSMAMNVLKGGHELVVHDINRDAVGNNKYGFSCFVLCMQGNSANNKTKNKCKPLHDR